MSYKFLFLISATLFMSIKCVSSSEISKAKKVNIRERLFKIRNGPCFLNQFRCQNNRCIDRQDFCNGRNNCGDNSDENYCSNVYNCPDEQEFITCRSSYNYKCIPKVWKCDGIRDCIDGQDEVGCEKQFEITISANQVFKAKLFATNWLLNERSNVSRIQKWGVNVPRTAAAFYFSNNLTMRRNYTSELAYELSISFLSKLALKRMEDIETPEMAAYVNSFLAFCINPRKFFVSDLIKELRKRVDLNPVANPYAMLALCNAGEFITENDIEKLLIAFQRANEGHRTDTQAMIIMALACASMQQDSSFNREDLPDYTLEIKKKQYRNGTVENIKTTALVLQALFASESEPDEDNFDEEKAIKQILHSQEKDGSFGGLINTYYVLPVLSMLSLVNISGDSCPKLTIGENEGLENLKIQVGVKWNISYSIWIGNDKVLQRSLTLSVPANTSFYGVMEYAASVDYKYKFEYNVRSRKPYIFSISGIMDDPEMEMFWYPCYLFENSSQPTIISKSPADVIPQNNEHMLFWYRKLLQSG